ncbi:unnamed protein product, partial [Meganyctiphanes norvegica]
ISEDVKEALENGYIVEDKNSTTSPFHCKLRVTPLSGLAPLKDHVQSTKHLTKASAASILSGISSSEISEDVKEALENGYIVEDKNSTTSPFHCKLCVTPLSGLAPLKDHVQSTKHLTKASAASILSGISSSEISEDVKEALENGYIVEDKNSTTSPFHCKLCVTPLSGLA